MTLEPHDILLIRQTFALFTLVARTAVKRLFLRLFELDPSLVAPLAADLPLRHARLSAALGGLVAAAGERPTVDDCLQIHGREAAAALGQLEGLTAAGYQALDETFQLALGRAYTFEAQQAWRRLLCAARLLACGSSDHA